MRKYQDKQMQQGPTVGVTVQGLVASFPSPVQIFVIGNDFRYIPVFSFYLLPRVVEALRS